MHAGLEYGEWMALLEAPANLVAELRTALAVRRAALLPPLLPFGAALIASGSGEPSLPAFEAALVRARSYTLALRFGPPAWKGRTLFLPPDAPTAELLERLGACFPDRAGSGGCDGIAAGEAIGVAAPEGTGGTPREIAPLSFRSFRLSLWRAARVDAPAEGLLLDPEASAWIRIRDRPSGA
ncbi:MAG: hypothetical protein JXA15_10990 [Spirochaetales bacterium]|nr:hypothetical protein [Spirochaetales bacterium]